MDGYPEMLSDWLRISNCDLRNKMSKTEVLDNESWLAENKWKAEKTEKKTEKKRITMYGLEFLIHGKTSAGWETYVVVVYGFRLIPSSLLVLVLEEDWGKSQYFCLTGKTKKSWRNRFVNASMGWSQNVLLPFSDLVDTQCLPFCDRMDPWLLTSFLWQDGSLTSLLWQSGPSAARLTFNPERLDEIMQSWDASKHLIPVKNRRFRLDTRNIVTNTFVGKIKKQSSKRSHPQPWTENLCCNAFTWCSTQDSKQSHPHPWSENLCYNAFTN